MSEKDYSWRDYLRNKLQTVAVRIVYRILEDLTDRRGLKHEFNACDKDIQKEIIETWLEIVSSRTK